MAARKDPRHDERTRLKIKTTQLVNRLQGCALGEVEMSTVQLRAAEILLKRTLPELTSIHQTTANGDTKTYEMWAKEIQEIVGDVGNGKA